MPTPAEVRATVDTWLANRWATVVSRQALYQATHGRYFQGLWTHRLLEPTDGIEQAPDAALEKPSDQAHGWSDLITLPATMPCMLKLDAYDGPLGQGFVGVVRVKLGTDWWRRSQNHGPETWRTRAWARQ